MPEVQPAPLVSVSVVSHGDGEELRLLLASLARHEPAHRLQLLITDNLGQDLPDVPLDGWHSVHMIRPSSPRGFARNHDEAFEQATGEFFCVLNPDVILEAPVLLRLVQRLTRGEGDIVAPLVLDSSGAVQDSFRPLPSPLELIRRRIGGAGTVASPVSGSLIRPDWIAGTFMLMRTVTFRKLGGFDPRFRMYFEDVDLCTRARLQGLTIVVDPGVRVRHDPRRSSRRPGLYLLWHLQSAFRFMRSDVYRRARRTQNA